jgi:hypothetical protein
MASDKITFRDPQQESITAALSLDEKKNGHR